MQCVDFLHYMQFSRPCQCLFTRYSQKKGCFLMPFSPEIACFSPVSHMLLCFFLISFGFVLDTEIIKNTNRFAVSGKGACKKGEVRRKVAAALSAAVTTTPKQENAPTYHGRTSQKESASLFPAALRERGSGGEALLSEKRPLPQRSPTPVFSGGSAREGTFLKKSPLPRIPHTTVPTTSSPRHAS